MELKGVGVLGVLIGDLGVELGVGLGDFGGELSRDRPDKPALFWAAWATLMGLPLFVLIMEDILHDLHWEF